MLEFTGPPSGLWLVRPVQLPPWNLEKISEIEKEIARTQKNKVRPGPGGARQGVGGGVVEPLGPGRPGLTTGPNGEPQPGAASDLDRQGRDSNPGLLAAGPGELALWPLWGPSRRVDPTGTSLPAA